MSGLRKWGDAKNIRLDSLGRCDNDRSNVLVGWHPMGCSGYTIPLALTVPGSTTTVYSQATIYYNSDCGQNRYWWGGTLPVPSGQFDAYSLATHEMGHAYGIAHTPSGVAGQQIMEADIPCIAASNRYTSLSQDDADAIRARYTGVSNVPASFPMGVGCIN